MSSNALDSQGMTIGRGDAASPEVYTTIPEVKSIDGPGGDATEIDTTDLSSTSKEFRMGLQDEGSVTLQMNWLPANTVHTGLRTDRANQTLRSFRITFTDSPASTLTFNAYVLGITISNSVDNVTEASVNLRVSGTPVWA